MESVKPRVSTSALDLRSRLQEIEGNWVVMFKPQHGETIKQIENMRYSTRKLAWTLRSKSFFKDGELFYTKINKNTTKSNM